MTQEKYKIGIIGLGISVPEFTAALIYYDSMRVKRPPANLIQAQRDYFGSYTYEGMDKRSVLHTVWGKE